MKILVVGAGAIGGYYGARLLDAGADVAFLVRPKRAAVLGALGLKVCSVLGDFDGPVHTVQCDTLKPGYDLILLSCKAFDLEAAIADFAPAVGPHTVVLPFLNGLGVYDRLDACFGRERVAGGVSYIATTLGADGIIRHDGVNDIVQVGARAPQAQETVQHFHGLISRSGGVRSMQPDIEQALWNKWVMLAAGSLMTCLMRGTIGDILASQDGMQLMNQSIDECGAVSTAEDHPPGADDLARIRARLLDPQSTWAASMMRDITSSAPRVEADAIVGDLLARAKRHKIDLPLARVAYCHLQVYQRQRRADVTAAE
ncbi:2-dehydropantoate 2-reductase [Trinickia mobilis]|uniref:2-dehydropantoate 2-reductase n=1 Tax=Trinickia mobilis TaxID=2816356 RepID=UPI001A8E7CB2|nr:2-dehydropantoate 2-reductase [Trinickia mobilis]